MSSPGPVKSDHQMLSGEVMQTSLWPLLGPTVFWAMILKLCMFCNIMDKSNMNILVFLIWWPNFRRKSWPIYQHTTEIQLNKKKNRSMTWLRNNFQYDQISDLSRPEHHLFWFVASSRSSQVKGQRWNASFERKNCHLVAVSECNPGFVRNFVSVRLRRLSLTLPCQIRPWPVT